jgi:hypothetical protein
MVTMMHMYFNLADVMPLEHQTFWDTEMHNYTVTWQE